MSSNLTFREALHKEDYLLAWPLVVALNPDLTISKYWHYQKDMLQNGNYTLILAFEDDYLIGICGYWIATKFYCGKYMEIDNFIIDSTVRGKRYGSVFTEYLEGIAKELSCETIMLDAYLENTRGHHFYERNGYLARGYHFLKKITDNPI